MSHLGTRVHRYHRFALQTERLFKLVGALDVIFRDANAPLLEEFILENGGFPMGLKKWADTNFLSRNPVLQKLESLEMTGGDEQALKFLDLLTLPAPERFSARLIFSGRINDEDTIKSLFEHSGVGSFSYKRRT
ncbi:unnamed protein product [Rhizoctonia solani]|uniref:Uncharacterized protein n=1 Tax=Rhizoctonia solani TaxID=456999 RepID=A0A8H3BWD1_9AGAM|nr:unnamed protein product [Rhizoctonia solani]